MYCNIFSVLNCAKEHLYCNQLYINKELQDINKIFQKIILLTFYLQEFKLTLDRIPKFAHIGDKTKNGKYARH